MVVRNILRKKLEWIDKGLKQFVLQFPLLKELGLTEGKGSFDNPKQSDHNQIQPAMALFSNTSFIIAAIGIVQLDVSQRTNEPNDSDDSWITNEIQNDVHLFSSVQYRVKQKTVTDSRTLHTYSPGLPLAFPSIHKYPLACFP